METSRTTSHMISRSQEEQAGSILTSRTRWAIFFISGIIIFCVYGGFFIAGAFKMGHLNLKPTPALVGRTFLKATNSTISEVLDDLAINLATVSYVTVRNPDITKQQKVDILMPWVGQALPNIMSIKPDNLCNLLLSLALHEGGNQTVEFKGDAPPNLILLLRNIMSKKNAQKEKTIVYFIPTFTMEYMTTARKAGIPTNVIKKEAQNVMGIAFIKAVGIEKINAAFQTLPDLVMGAVLIRERPKCRRTVLISLGPMVITYCILTLYLFIVIRYRNHFVVRKRGKFYLYQLFFSCYAILIVQFCQSYVFSLQVPDAILNSQLKYNMVSFVVLEISVFLANVYGFALIQRLDMMYQAFSRGENVQAKKLSPYSFFRLAWLSIVCTSISTVSVAVYYFIDESKDKLRQHMDYFTIGMFVDFVIYIVLALFYISRLLRENGTGRFLDFNETLRHLVFQILGFLFCVIAITVDTQHHIALLVILSYFWSVAATWFVVDVFSLPMWLFIGDMLYHRSGWQQKNSRSDLNMSVPAKVTAQKTVYVKFGDQNINETGQINVGVLDRIN